LDLRVLPYLPQHGTFLEIGANDGFSQSNTYFLARAHGWKGILIEPVPRLYERCRRVRSESVVFNRACVAPGGPAVVHIVDRGLMSVVLGMQSQREEANRLAGSSTQTLTVLSATLSELIDETPFSQLDFMSIDVEGAELEVLKGLDLDRHMPRWLLVETKHPDDVTRLLAGHAELVTKLTHHDYLLRALGTPPVE
jgi:FkbM family methyltransferase